MRACDLNLDVIKKAHADDAEAYRPKRGSPQHQHRHWLLKHIEKLEEQLKEDKK